MTSNNVPLNLPENSVCPVRIVAPYPITHEFKATHEFVGKTLLEMMCTKFPFRTKSEWNKRIEEGRVFLENRDSKPDTILTNFDEIRHHNPAVIEPSVPDKVRIIEETDTYLAVFKPAPMPMHPGGRYFKNTLKSILEEEGFEGLKITHRLDAVTSGIVLFAKNKEFSTQVMQAFMNGEVDKEYHATVYGIPTEPQKIIQSKIRRKHGFVFESGGELDSGQLGITHFEVISSSPDTKTSLIRCNPITGRTHQIRLHLAEWGYPIIDDPIYGPHGDRSSRKTQNVGISLISKHLYISSLDINVKC